MDMDLKQFDKIDFETIEKYDPDLVWNVKSLLESKQIYECFYVEYQIRIILILSLHKGKHIRLHDIDKETGKTNMINIMGDTWQVVKEMMKVNKGKNKPKQKDQLVDVKSVPKQSELPPNVVIFPSNHILH